MRTIRACMPFAACVASACLVAGCFVESGPRAEPAWGSLLVLSSIDGSTRGSDCDRVGAVDLEVAVYDGSTPVTTVTAYCDDFEVVVDLPEGTYDADVTLIDARSRAVSTTARIGALRILAASDLSVEVDFPWASILP
jgi:hypothetical protein